MKAQKAVLAAIAVGAAALAIAYSCSRAGPEGGSTGSAPSSTTEAPLRAPDDLLATAVLTTPDASWGKMQRAIGGTIGLIPSTLGGLVTALAGIDAALAPEIDGNSPVYFALSGKPEDPSWVISAHLSDARHARALVVGDAGKFGTKEAFGMTELLPRENMSNVVVALDGDRVIVARHERDFESLGAYASRALPKKPSPPAMLEADVPASAIAHVSAELKTLWTSLAEKFLAQEKEERDAHAGKEADFADTKAVFEIADGLANGAISGLSDFEDVKLTVDFADDGLHLTTLAHPKDGAGPARAWIDAMQSGDAHPLLATTGDARASMLLRTSPGWRASHAASFSESLQKTLGARLSDDDKKNIARVASGIEKGAGDEITIVVPSTQEHALAITTKPIANDSAKEAFSAIAALLQAKAFRDPLKIRTVVTETKIVDAAIHADVTTITREPSKPAKPTNNPPSAPPPFGFATTLDANGLVASAGNEPFAVVVAAKSPSRRIGDDRAIAAPLEAIKDASFVLLLQPYKLEPTHLGKPPAPVIFALGKRDGDALGQVYISTSALSEIAKRGSF